MTAMYAIRYKTSKKDNWKMLQVDNTVQLFLSKQYAHKKLDELVLLSTDAEEVYRVVAVDVQVKSYDDQM